MGQIEVYSHLPVMNSIAAALHTMATDENSEVMEFPQGETELSAGLVLNPLQRDAEGLVHAPRTPGKPHDHRRRIIG